MFQHTILSYHKALYREVFNAELSTTEQKSSSIAMQQLMSSALRRAVGHQSGTSRNESWELAASSVAVQQFSIEQSTSIV